MQVSLYFTNKEKIRLMKKKNSFSFQNLTSGKSIVYPPNPHHDKLPLQVSKVNSGSPRVVSPIHNKQTEEMITNQFFLSLSPFTFWRSWSKVVEVGHSTFPSIVRKQQRGLWKLPSHPSR